MADTTTERSRWLVLIQLAITNQKRASVERGCSKVLTFSQRSETAPWIRQDPKPLRTPAGTAYFGGVAGSTSLTTAAPRATQLRFSYLCFSQIQIWLIQWGLRTFRQFQPTAVIGIARLHTGCFSNRAALQHCAMLLSVFDLPPIVLVPPAPISRPSNPEGRNK